MPEAFQWSAVTNKMVATAAQFCLWAKMPRQEWPDAPMPGTRTAKAMLRGRAIPAVNINNSNWPRAPRVPPTYKVKRVKTKKIEPLTRAWRGFCDHTLERSASNGRATISLLRCAIANTDGSRLKINTTHKIAIKATVIRCDGELPEASATRKETSPEAGKGFPLLTK